MRGRILAIIGVLSLLTAVLYTVTVATHTAPPLEERVATLEALHGIDYSHPETPTATTEPTATNTPAPTATPIPTETPVPPTATPEPLSGWHAPTNHEHGDAPPAWAENWSITTYGHGIVYGGDESTPNENDLKHAGYKGYLGSAIADDGSTVDIYARLHMLTNPTGRAARYHSTEWYFRDATGNVSHMQYWADVGEVPADRYSVGSYYPETSAALTASATTDASVDPQNIIISAYQDYSNMYEIWYNQTNVVSGGWHPVWVVFVLDPGTYTDGTVRPGAYGTDRRLQIRWIAEGNTGDSRYANRNLVNPRGWFCTDVFGEIQQFSVSGHGDCVTGTLPQYIAPTLPTIGDDGNASPFIRIHNWSVAGLELPN